MLTRPQKRLKGHKHIVTYIDSHASHLKTGGYEVFLLMEYCSGRSLDGHPFPDTDRLQAED